MEALISTYYPVSRSYEKRGLLTTGYLGHDSASVLTITNHWRIGKLKMDVAVNTLAV